MATVDQYVATIVEKYHVAADTGSEAHRAADELVPLLKQWGKQYLLGITLSGAYAKNTAIHLSSDVDLLIAVKPVPKMDMKQIFWSLFEFLTDQGLKPHTRGVSIQVERHGLFVDLIPACCDRGGHLLFNKRSGAIVETDVARHVHVVANSGRQQEICALKIWRERCGLDFPSLYLEMTALKALETERFGQLADNVLTVLRFLAGHFGELVVRDPANARNVLSSDLTREGKLAITTAARKALYDENWKKIVW